VFGRNKTAKLIRHHLAKRGILEVWWPTAEQAIAHCAGGDPREPLLTGAGPMPARSVVVLLGLEPFVGGELVWSVLPDELTDPGGAFYPPNNDMTIPETEQRKIILQEWFFPSGDKEGFSARLSGSQS